MQRLNLTALNWVWACRGGVRQPGTGSGHAEVGFKLGAGMQRWGSTALNLVWACGGGVRQP